ncbi:SdpI family protein [Paenarthrobacter sp. NPDC090520]|uniref:SdpI family protein n=1 Tax=Paenarthrobacter sp. NPDC090520 TaxID=3364382 RepID=UPI00381FFD39
MSGDQIGIVVGLSVLGAVLLVGGILSLFGRLPMNPTAGIRIPSTLTSEGAWKAGHKAAAPWLILGGMGAGTGAVVGPLLPSAELGVLAFACAVVAVAFLIVGCLAASKAAVLAERSLGPSESEGHQ